MDNAQKSSLGLDEWPIERCRSAIKNIVADALSKLKVISTRPMARALSKTEVHLRISEHKMLSFSVRKEIIQNNNGLVGILLSKVGKNDFFHTL